MSNIYDQIDLVLSFIPLVIIGCGLITNTICFFVFRFSDQFKTMSSMVILSFVVILDTLSLFDWNLNHYLQPNFGFSMEYLNLFTCKFVLFIQYFSLQSSAFLLSFVSIDRFVTIRKIPGSIYSRLPFGTVKSAFFWSMGIVLAIFILNMHILILNGYYKDPVIRLRNVTVGNITYTEPYVYQKAKLVCYVYKTGFTVSLRVI